ncbi:efflux RND transporter periplasmic adaptor subunit [Verrucomicrobiota bacterium sgz303538]
MKSLSLPLFILPCAIALAACHSKHETAAKVETAAPIAVQTCTVETRPVPRFLELTGELKGGRTSSVAADASGKVRETLVERGSVVESGDVLVKLDDRAASLGLREAEATLAQAQARLTLARGDWKRNEHLAKSKLIAPAEEQKVEADVLGREADVAAAEARRDSALKALEDTEVRAPFAGTVAERLINAGEYVQPGAKVAVMIATEDLRLWLNVPETAAGAVRQGQPLTFRVPAFPGTDFTGKVRYISPIVRESGRDLLVEAEVEAADGRLLQGMFAEVRLSLAEKPGLVVPASAVRKDGGLHKVLVTEGEHLSERIVEIGMKTESWTEIRTGLAEGESVVLQPTQETKDGTRFVIAAR